MKTIPINHHYIPRFILRNFCTVGDNLCYYDIKRKMICMKETANVFAIQNLYKDVNNINPVQIEEDLSKFENEVSVIIKKMLSEKTDVEITLEDNEKLMLFFAIMGLRSINARKQFTQEGSKEFYSFWQKDGNITDFWKRNLSFLVKCRSLKEVFENKNIDDPIKLFIRRDTIGVINSHFIIVERRGGEDFILSDAYPVFVWGDTPFAIEMRMFTFFPLSPSRLLILAEENMKYVPLNVRIFDDYLLTKPSISIDKKKIKFHIRKMYENHVKYINSVIMENCKEGFIFQNEKRISSIKKILDKMQNPNYKQD